MQIDEQLQSLVYFLTDHLFAAQEAGENIRMARFRRQMKNDGNSDVQDGNEILEEFNALRSFVSELSDWEEELVTKTIQARKWGTYLKDHDSHFKPIIDLFTSATHPFTDIAAQIRDHHDRHFEGGDHPDWFIQSRALTSKKSNQGQILSLETGDMYLIGGHVRLNQVMELIETYLDSLEARFPQLWLPTEDILLSEDTLEDKGIN